MARALTGGSVEYNNSEPASVGLFKLCEGCGQFAETPRSSVENTWQKQRGKDKKLSAAETCLVRNNWPVGCSFRLALSGKFFAFHRIKGTPADCKA